jgi:hypothetical protein
VQILASADADVADRVKAAAADSESAADECVADGCVSGV